MSDEIPIPGLPDCRSQVIHQAAVDKVAAGLPDGGDMERLSSFFSIFGDISRIRILEALSIHELCVCDLSAALQVGRSSISHQLKLLRLADAVAFRREGKVVYYSLKDNHVRDILTIGLAHLGESR